MVNIFARKAIRNVQNKMLNTRILDSEKIIDGKTAMQYPHYGMKYCIFNLFICKCYLVITLIFHSFASTTQKNCINIYYEAPVMPK